MDGFPLCAVPPMGAVAPSRGTTVASLKLLKGYFRTSNKSSNVMSCYNTDACLGGSDIAEYCKPGYMGPCKKSLVTGSCFLGRTFGMPARNRAVVVRPRYSENNITINPYGSPCQVVISLGLNLRSFPVSMVPFHSNRPAFFSYGFTWQFITQRPSCLLLTFNHCCRLCGLCGRVRARDCLQLS